MDFILGIFTGISIAILWGMYLNKQRRKEQEAKSVDDQYKRFQAWLRGPDEMSQFAGFDKPINSSKYLNRLLELAIERDDFEEAARLRDLMNKK